MEELGVVPFSDIYKRLDHFQADRAKILGEVSLKELAEQMTERDRLEIIEGRVPKGRSEIAAKQDPMLAQFGLGSSFSHATSDAPFNRIEEVNDTLPPHLQQDPDAASGQPPAESGASAETSTRPSISSNQEDGSNAAEDRKFLMEKEYSADRRAAAARGNGKTGRINKAGAGNKKPRRDPALTYPAEEIDGITYYTEPDSPITKTDHKAILLTLGLDKSDWSGLYRAIQHGLVACGSLQKMQKLRSKKGGAFFKDLSSAELKQLKQAVSLVLHSFRMIRADNRSRLPVGPTIKRSFSSRRTNFTTISISPSSPGSTFGISLRRI